MFYDTWDVALGSRYLTDNMQQNNVAHVACHKTISCSPSIVQHHKIKTNINLIFIQPVVVNCSIIPSIRCDGEIRCKHMVLMFLLACTPIRSHPPLILPRIPKYQRLAPQSMALWDSCMLTKNRRPQPSSSYIRSMRKDFRCTEQIHSQIVRLDRDDVMNLSMCTRASPASTDELLYSIVRMPKMYVASSCPLSAACNMCWSPSALEPNL
jgi:hypothetical protein